MKRIVITASLALLVVGCQSEFDRCVEIGTAAILDLSRHDSPAAAKHPNIKKRLAMVAKKKAWAECASGGRQ